MRWTAEVRERWRALFFRSREDAEMEEEMRFHLEMEAEKNLRAGMSPAEARRQAAIAFGGREKHKEEVRDARGLAWVPGLSLDFRLGARMMRKHPGLTLIGGLGMAVAMAVGGGFFTVLYSTMLPEIPLPEGDRVVGIENWNLSISNNERPSLHDFVAWRDELRSVEDLGAFRNVGRNLVVPGGTAEPVSAAEITASGFRAARVPPLLGRPLVEDDERPGAAPVVVLGHEVWRRRFAADPGVVGREVRLGGTVHTVVGVMPEGFAFPVSHRLWLPLREDPSAYPPGSSPTLTVFGRLAPGWTLQSAGAELAAAGERAAAASPSTHAQIRPRVLPYPAMFVDGVTMGEVNLVQLMASLLLVVVAVNVAVLVYARTATRTGEIAVRSALGASRRRIVAQLFTEALVLSSAAAAAALGILWLVLGQMRRVMLQLGSVPFWVDLEISAGTVLYVLCLTLVGALIVGAAPALQATGRRMQASLRELGGGSGLQMGRTWTTLIVAQVALAVAVLPAALYTGAEWLRYGFADPGFAAERYLAAELAMDRDAAPGEPVAARLEFERRFGDRLSELKRRLESEPGVAAVSWAAREPGSEGAAWIEVEGVPGPVGPESSYNLVEGTRAGYEVRTQSVDPDLFATFDVPLLAGRRLEAEDLGEGASAAVVNRSFAGEVLGGASALGHRFRYVGRGGDAPSDLELGRWYEVVGVVEDFPNAMAPTQVRAKLYHAAIPGAVHPVTLVVRTQGVAPESLVGRLRALSAVLDPSLQLRRALPLDERMGQDQGGMRLAALAVAVVTLSVLLLSAAGIYALMSFTVTRRRREIGIRTALGADPRRILGSIFSRVVRQLALGLLVGAVVAVLLDRLAEGGMLYGKATLLLPAVAAMMLAVGLLAALGPARRGLRIQPTEALREE